MAKGKFVQNVHIALVKCKIEIDGEERRFEFQPERKDRIEQRVIHTGYVRVTDEELKALREQSKLFTSLEKQRLLVVHDEAPAGALTPYDVLTDTKEQVSILESKVQAQADVISTLQVKNQELQDLADGLQAKIDKPEKKSGKPDKDGKTDEDKTNTPPVVTDDDTQPANQPSGNQF